KLASTYGEAYLRAHFDAETGRIYPRYNPLGAVTGRIISSGPNVQQLPKAGPYRRYVVPAAGWVWGSLDLSQTELTLAAHRARDAELLALLADEQDVYAQAAAALFDVPVEDQPALVKGDPRREFGKMVLLGNLYGQQFSGFYRAVLGRG